METRKCGSALATTLGYCLKEVGVFVLNVSAMGKGINPILDAKQHVCARKDKSNLESRFINVIKGYGVFATTWIEEGSFIVEYRGVLREAGQCIPDAYSYYFIYNNTRYCIDASVDDGSLGRLVNDDSNPNAKVKVISISRIPHLCLFALRDIQPGEEITYDYGGYDLPWRRGTWLCMGNPSHLDNNKEECEEPPSESDITEQTIGQQDQEACTEGTTPSQTVNEECEEEVPMRADKATQTTEQNTSVEQMIWKYIPYQCLTSEHQRICENQLHQIQLTPATQQILFKEDKKINEDPATSGQHVPDVELTSNNEEASESQLPNQMTDEVGNMECNEEAEQQILEQQQTSMEVEPSVEGQSCPVSAAQSMSEEEQPKCQDEPCQTQLAEQTQNATQSSEADQESYLSSEDSNDETVSSDEEFLPDSDTDSDEDSDIEKPKKKAKTSVTSKEIEEQAPAAQCAMKELRETPSAQSYADLCKVTLAQILMFNRRHGEVSQMTIKSLQERDQAQASEISEALTELEKVFCEEYCKILVRQKIGALVPIILTPDMINALMLLTEKRDQCSVSKSNIYVFGQPRSNRCYRGENALRICANECGAMNPDRLTSTRFSRHISTLSQVLTLKNHELKKLAKFIGHDISLRKEYYRQTEATPRLAKICKLILAIEKGSATEMLGQSLDDIVLPDEIRESDSEDEYFEEDDAFLKDREARRELALHLLSKKKMTKPKTSNKICSVPDPTPKKQHNESTSKEQENESTSKEQDKKSTTEEPKGKPAQEQTEKKKLKTGYSKGISTLPNAGATCAEW
ncbi:hypothetical protein PGIGA_G00014790 [Pangasianodon gigas]|uniref:Uncharacterized protein n=1 Tax=Pangasianodon gigas TaxID=30993 RepID=A0ACC5WU77_PANGG|nr:hypothetical protein [Pangasianodon gigas]